MNKRIRKNVNWRLLDMGRKFYLINVVNSKQLELKSDKEQTQYLFGLFEEWRSKSEVIKIFRSKYPSFDINWPKEYINLLIKNNVLEYQARKPNELSDQYLMGLDRQLNFLSEINNNKSSFENQLTLKRTKVALLGLGSVAHYTIMGLVSSGIGSFKCVDCDTVDERNIGRQPIFRKSDIGRLKADVVKEYILNNRENVEVQAFNVMLKSEKDVEKIIFDCDIVIHLCDLPRFLIHRWINDACLQLNKPNILCYSGRVGPFCIPYKTACYGCLETEMRKKFVLYQSMVEDVTNGAFTRFPELAVVGSLSGVLVAKEIIAFILNIKPQTFDAFYDINPFDLKISLHKLQKQKDCYACSEKL